MAPTTSHLTPNKHKEKEIKSLIMECFRGIRNTKQDSDDVGSSFEFPATILKSPHTSTSPYSSADRNISQQQQRSFGGSPLPLPKPPPALPKPETSTTLRTFSLEELAGACQNFSHDFLCRDGGAGRVYKASLFISEPLSKMETRAKVDITDSSLTLTKRGSKWMAELSSLAVIQHLNLCRILGYHEGEKSSGPSKRRVLVVYAAMPNGGLDSLLYRRPTHVPPLDWRSRAGIALGVAQGLSFLHEFSPAEPMYGCFQTCNVQIDRDFMARLTDYCFARKPPPPGTAEGYVAPETRRSGLVIAKSNVWSYGIVVLELLTGRQNMEELFAQNERDLVEFCRPFVEGKKKIHLMMDPELKGMYSLKTAQHLARLAMECVNDNALLRPTIKDVTAAVRAYTQLDYSHKSDQLSKSMKDCNNTKAKTSLARSLSMSRTKSKT